MNLTRSLMEFSFKYSKSFDISMPVSTFDMPSTAECDSMLFHSLEVLRILQSIAMTATDALEHDQ